MSDQKIQVGFFQVEERFIREAYEAACPTWKAKLEEKFPVLFPKNYIGLSYSVDDLSYHSKIDGKDAILKAGSIGVIVEAPYDVRNSYIQTHKYVHVLVANTVYSVLFNEKSIINTNDYRHIDLLNTYRQVPIRPYYPFGL